MQGGQDPETVQADRLERLAAGIDTTARVYMSEEKAQRFLEDILAMRSRFAKNGRPSAT